MTYRPRYPRTGRQPSRPNNQHRPVGRATPTGHRAASDTSWEEVSGWYSGHLSERNTLLGDIVYPGALRLLEPKNSGSYLDIACGDGTFVREALKKGKTRWTGIDASPSLIERARQIGRETSFRVADAAQLPQDLGLNTFDGASCLLAIQNIKNPAEVFRGAARVLKPGASFVLVLNHPCFRIPRQSSWGFDEGKKWMYRRVDRYLTPMDIPILAHPGANRQTKTLSFHRPISFYINELARAGFSVDALEEWVSNRESKPGARAKAENTSRAEFPLFLALRAKKTR